MKVDKLFSIIGCQHAHIKVFIEEMFDLGYKCAGIYESGNRSLANQISEEYKINIVEDYESLLNDSVELVGCAAINNEKINIIKLCEKYNKHIMLDKPVVTNWKDFNILKELIKRNNIQVGLLLTERFRPELYKLKTIINSGELGNLISVQMRKPHLLKAETRPSWHFSKEQSGGIIIDLFIHDFDLLRWLSNKEISNSYGIVSKNILREYPSFYDTASVQVKMENGIIANLYADWHTASESWTWGDCRIFITGTEGSAEVRLEGDPFIQEKGLLFLVTNQSKTRKINCTDTVYPTVTKDFINRLNGKRHIIKHSDILSAIHATLETEKNASYLNNLN